MKWTDYMKDGTYQNLQVEIDNLVRPTSIKQIGSIISTLLKKKRPSPHGSSSEWH